MRIALIVSYSGENYHGWQSQREPIRTVQDELTAAVNFVANSPVKLICAGRTIPEFTLLNKLSTLILSLFALRALG